MTKQRCGDGPSRYLCSHCPHRYHHTDFYPKKVGGVTMHQGDQFCMGGKKPRKFRGRDPKVNVPDWCPKLKKPREVRIYGFKSTQDWAFHQEECLLFGGAVSASARRYYVEYELETDLTAQDFWKGLRTETAASLLGAVVHRYHVVEIDDGLKPVFFYNTGEGFKVLVYFNAEIARNNKKEEPTHDP